MCIRDSYYAEKDRAERLRTKSKELHKAVHNMYERAVRKQAARQEELAASGKSDKLRLYGELLSACLLYTSSAFCSRGSGWLRPEREVPWFLLVPVEQAALYTSIFTIIHRNCLGIQVPK